MKPVKFVKLMGKIWRLKYVDKSTLDKNHKIDGEIDAPNIKNKAMRIGKGLKGLKEMETYVHEANHGCRWHEDEEYVHESSADVANFLYRLLYRRLTLEQYYFLQQHFPDFK